ncbi:probable G-protein coupled receptor Mth-like 7 [Drosophila subpulchrella]|uniref:probable G-protein coupled receptor Mth-like 7 n=1 Tax=Drosophila subpulchrella TaxID=1486046 RepID=UPI0018A1A353|nr:probable G-protein coupled receptor Mth-like 7 [Drosophila subpulchrella]
MQNNSYKYDDLLIPANLTGEYDYIEMLDGSKESAKRHLRACVCKLRPCVTICCPRKNILANGECYDGLKENIALVNPYLKLTPKDGSMVSARYNLNDMTVIRREFQECDELIREDEYTLYQSLNLSLLRKEYCLYPYQFNLDFPKSIWIVKHNCLDMYLPATFEIMMVAMVCNVLTIAVYLYIKKLRNVIGKCLIGSLCCMFIVNLIRTLDYYSMLINMCLAAGYVTYLFRIAYSMWVCFISYHLWKENRSLHAKNPRYSFLTYNVFVWGTSAFATGVIVLMDNVWGRDLHNWNWLPLVGYSACYLRIGTWYSWIYYFGPLMILGIFNVVMFILTAIPIWKVKSELKKFKQRPMTTCLNFDSQTYAMFIRLSALMGVSWMLNFLSFFTKLRGFSNPLISLVNYIHFGFGIIIFILLVVKRSTFRLLMDRIRGTR